MSISVCNPVYMALIEHIEWTCLLPHQTFISFLCKRSLVLFLVYASLQSPSVVLPMIQDDVFIGKSYSVL